MAWAIRVAWSRRSLAFWNWRTPVGPSERGTNNVGVSLLAGEAVGVSSIATGVILLNSRDPPTSAINTPARMAGLQYFRWPRGVVGFTLAASETRVMLANVPASAVSCRAELNAAANSFGFWKRSSTFLARAR